MADTYCCAVCEATTKLLRCAGCKSVYYCGTQHQKKDWSSHRAKCKELSGIDKDLDELTDLPVCIAPFVNVEKPFDSIHIKNWDHVFEHISLKIQGGVFRKYATEELSWPLTFLSSICQFNLHNKSKLRIHVMGPKERCFSEGYFTDLLKIFPLPDTEIVLIGPEIEKTSNPLHYENTIGSSISVFPIAKCYHEYTTHQEYVLPDLVVACHPGIQSNQYEWKPTLKYIVSNSLPTVFTCWNEDELLNHYKVLNSEDIAVDVICKGRAPFPSTLKRRLNLSTKKNGIIIMTMNSYWICFKGGACTTDAQVNQRMSNAVEEVLGVSATQLTRYSRDNNMPGDITSRITECKLQLQFIRCLRSGEKQYRQEVARKTALETFAKCIALWEQHKAKYAYMHMLRRVTSRALNNIGIISLEKGDLDKAIEVGEQAVNIDPTFHDAHKHLGVYYSRKSELAMAHCTKALALYPVDSEYWRSDESAVVRGHVEEGESALKRFEECKQRAEELSISDVTTSGKSYVQKHFEKLREVEECLKELHLF